MINLYTELTLQSVEETSDAPDTKSDLLRDLWSCMNIIEDYSRDRKGDYKTIFRAVMNAQHQARLLDKILEVGYGN